MKHWSLACGSLLLPACLAHAAGATDAGALQQQIEQTRRQAAPAAAPAPAPRPSQAGARPASELTVSVAGFDFVGNVLVPTATLEQATQGLLNRPLSLKELRSVSDAVQAVYRKAGWMVHVSVPPQEISNQRVRVEITEARLGKVVTAGQSTRMAPRLIADTVTQQLAPNEPIVQLRLERALLLINDLPGISSSASFAQGDKPGHTDLVVQVTDKPMVNGTIGLDNMGASVTGSARLTGTMNVNSPLKLGDLLSLSGLETEGSRYGRAAYSAPLGRDGWRLGVHATDMTYRATSLLKGKASTQGLDGSYPVIRHQRHSLTLNGSWVEKHFRNEDGVTSGTDFRVKVGSVGIAASSRDEWTGGFNSAALQWSGGEVVPRTQLPDANTQGHFSKWLLTLGRVQPLGSNLSLQLASQVQRTPKTLDSSEKLYLGGAYGVRAYPTGEGSANEGESLSIDLNMRLQDGLVLQAFYDWAHARNPRDATPDRRDFHLSGYGVGATWQTSTHMQIKALAAWRAGEAPQSTPSPSSSRLWVSANLSF